MYTDTIVSGDFQYYKVMPFGLQDKNMLLHQSTTESVQYVILVELHWMWLLWTCSFLANITGSNVIYIVPRAVRVRVDLEWGWSVGIMMNSLFVCTLTHSLYIKRQYPISSLTFCGADPNDTRWVSVCVWVSECVCVYVSEWVSERVCVCVCVCVCVLHAKRPNNHFYPSPSSLLLCIVWATCMLTHCTSKWSAFITE